jgi:hypothetical protein
MKLSAHFEKGGTGMERRYVAVFGLCLALAVFLSGCAGSNKYMRETSDTAVTYTPTGDEAVVVFMRPSGLGFAISSSVFDISKEADNKFVGIVPAKKKVIYKTNPGPHMFMVIGESADFMRADLQGGKTYYALVTPRMGFWKARFSLRPVTQSELATDEFKDWTDSCELVENTEGAHQWAEEHAPSIQSKREEYIIKWNNKADEDKPVLKASDGK